MPSQNYVLLERIELNQSAASVTFANIPQTGYTDLKVVWSARRESGAGYAIVDFNGLATANFSHKVLEGNGASAYSFVSGNTNYAGPLDASTDTASTFSNCEMYIPNYTSANPKSFTIDAVSENNGTTAYADMIAGLWNNTAAITAVKLSPHNGTNFVAGSTFSLYGIANASTTPAKAPKASGGNVIATDGTYWYHAFLSNGTFTPQVGLTCDILQVAGGGGGGGNGGGGGAGGLLTFTAQNVSTAQTVTVGAGGVAGVQAGSPSNATQGVNSQFGSLTASVGGGRGVTSSLFTSTGGSGGSGGGANYTGTGGSGTAGQGYNGGNGFSTAEYGNGGGGGAGGIGANGTSSTGGAGGVGVYSTLTDAMGAITSTGQLNGGHYYYAGGGGGCVNTGTGGAGGLGGGATGTGSLSGGAAPSGTVNTGGGGAGGGGSSSNYTAGAGGSGIVIVRYLVA